MTPGVKPYNATGFAQAGDRMGAEADEPSV